MMFHCLLESQKDFLWSTWREYCLLYLGYHLGDESDLNGLLAFAHGKEVRSVRVGRSRRFPRSRYPLVELQNAVKELYQLGLKVVMIGILTLIQVISFLPSIASSLANILLSVTNRLPLLLEHPATPLVADSDVVNSIICTCENKMERTARQ